MFDTWTLRVLVEVAERGSFSAAAEALHMTQPAVSRQIGGIERQVGLRLFDRSPRGVKPTPAGDVAVAYARDVLDGIRAMTARLATFSDLTSGQLRLAAFPSANTGLMPEAIRRFRAAHPGIELTLQGRDPVGPLAAVRAGDVDLALITRWDLYANPWAAKLTNDRTTVALDGVDLVPLLDEELLVALPADHRLARLDRIRLADLRDETWIEGAFPDCLGPLAELTAALGRPPSVGFHCDDWTGKQSLVAIGCGVTLVPTLARGDIRQGVVMRATMPRLPPRRLYAAIPPQGHRAPAAEAMLTLLIELTQQQRY
ncbi:LysR family transcriptional regulator [Actinoplanes xinjiangensis]|uniref:LysR family transcriptional regulator n=1 Tax=Actinoplanes xinjiangensis TaxID=512350 RepID=UPI003428D2D2